MKFLPSIVLIALLSADASAGVLSPQVRLAHRTGHRAAHAAAAAQREYYPVIIEIDSEDAVDRLEALGIEFWGRRGELLLALVPADEIDALDGIAGIRHVSSTAQISAVMDVGRPFVGAEALQAAPEGLTGRGVTVGFSDGGFDPSHPAFRGRVRRVADFRGLTGEVLRATSAAEIDAWDTDDDSEWHATHVGGILCGGEGNAPQYRGIAPGASLVACTSELTDVAILAGVEEVIASAKAAGGPAVVNLSLSSSLGPHDGTSAFCRYIDRCAEDAVITISAGNYGNQPVSLTHTFSAERPTAATMLFPYAYYSPGVATVGYQDFWSADSRAFEVRICAYDRIANEIFWTGEWLNPYEFASQQAQVSTPESLSELSATMEIGWEVNPTNGRFNLTTRLASSCSVTYNGINQPRYLAAIDLRGPQGLEISGFTDFTFSFYRFYKPEGAMVGPDMSINDMATAHKVLSVGSLVTRNPVTLIDGTSEYWASQGDGPTAQYTSYGTLADGRTLPMVSAPGSIIIAPISSAYLRKNPDAASATCLRDSEGYYYAPQGGTSMAAPMVAGVCALWLEAAPWLTPAEVIEVAVNTANPALTAAADPRSGAGCIDAAAGLRYIREQAGAASLNTDGAVSIRRSGAAIEAADAFGNPLAIEVYDLSGRRLSPASVAAGPVVVKSAAGAFAPRLVR